MGDKKIVKFEQVESVIDHDTGEIIETRKKTAVKVDKEPNYIKMYVADIVRLKDVPNGMSPILLKLVGNMGYNNIIPAFKPIKKMICKDLDISLDYLNKAIQKFYEKGLFIRVDRGVYMADPELFARGKWDEIKELRLIIDYKEDKSGKIKKTLKSNLAEEVQLRLGL